MKIKQFGLTVSICFYFHRIFKKRGGGGGGAEPPLDPPMNIHTYNATKYDIFDIDLCQ